jgi:uncharacterized membrane protein
MAQPLISLHPQAWNPLRRESQFQWEVSMKLSHLIVVALIASGLAPKMGAGTLTYTLYNYGLGHIDENTHYAIPAAINNSPQIVGLDSPTNDTFNAFYYGNGVFKYFDETFAENNGSEGIAINGLGIAVVDVIENGAYTDAAIWNPLTGAKTRIHPMDGCQAVFAFAINNLGQVVGESLCFSYARYPFLYDHGQSKMLSPDGSPGRAYGINNRGDIIGVNGAGPFLIHNGVFALLDVGPIAIDNDGDILCNLPNGGQGLYRYGKVTVLELPGSAFAMSPNGNILGVKTDGSWFVRIRGIVYDVNIQLTGDFTSIYQLYGINDNGAIIGRGMHWDCPTGFIATPRF